MSWSFDTIRKTVPIGDVVKALGLVRKGHSVVCWRHDDHNPSVHVMSKANRVRCYVCDSKGLSNIDLVASVRGLSILQAAEWLGETFGVAQVPGKGKKTKASSVLKYNTDYQRLPQPVFILMRSFVRSDSFKKMRPREAKLATVLVMLTIRELMTSGKGSIELCHKELREHTGYGKDTLIRAISKLKSLGLVHVQQAGNKRKQGECNTYTWTFGKHHQKFIKETQDLFRTKSTKKEEGTT
jgi:hypothetical protein